MKTLRDTWTGCYPSNWKGLIVPEAIKHPAKFSSKLIARIYQHMKEEGWIKPGDIVLDPFGGVALGAFNAMQQGLRWRGVELEANFADLGNRNIGYWNSRFSRMPHWCTDATLFQGDSRKLLEVIQGADQAVSSPPYADSMERKGGFDPEKSKYKAGPNSQMLNADTGYSDVAGAVSSPPYAEARIGQQSGQESCGRGDQYGATPGQLGAMQASDFDVALSSPPFRQQSGGTNTEVLLGRGDPELIKRHSAGNAAAHGYGESDGQLANMQDGQFDQAVSSPPFNENKSNAVHGETKGFHSYDENESKNRMKRDYELADHPDSLGLAIGDSFWISARQIVDQVYLALRPGAHAVWVVKGFIKNKQYVDFPLQWQMLCEAAGFVTVHIHQALLTNHRGKSYTLEGGTVEHKTEAKSFFRRNGEQKARAAKWWDTSGLSRECKADWLYAAHDLKWRQYHQDLAKNSGRAIKQPKAFIILGKAQSMAYEAAGSPDIQIDTSIDFETVLCMVKAEEA